MCLEQKCGSEHPVGELYSWLMVMVSPTRWNCADTTHSFDVLRTFCTVRAQPLGVVFIQEANILFFFSVRAWSVTQSCLTLHHSRDYSSLGSSVHGIFQARILEWVAISYSRGSSWPRGQIRISCFGRWVRYHCATWKAVFLFTCFWLHWVLVAACRPSLVVVSSGHSPVSCA